MLTSVGKKQISAAMAIFGSMPLPSSSTRIGALATTGMVLISTTIGKNASSSALLVDEHGRDHDRRDVAEQEAADRLDRRRPEVAPSACRNCATSVVATTAAATARRRAAPRGRRRAPPRASSAQDAGGRQQRARRQCSRALRRAELGLAVRGAGASAVDVGRRVVISTSPAARRSRAGDASRMLGLAHGEVAVARQVDRRRARARGPGLAASTSTCWPRNTAS